MHDQWDKPIITLPDAEAYFRAMGCSHFHMSREYPNRYSEYRRMGIPKKQEATWTRAEFQQTLEAMTKGHPNARELWAQHSYLVDLLRFVNEPDLLQALLQATARLVDIVPSWTRILVAETLVGRSRFLDDGPIYLAHELGDNELADRFAQLVPRFCDGRSAPQGGPPIEKRKAAVIQRLQEMVEKFRL